MYQCLGGIFTIPWSALLFVFSHWATGMALVWGLGFAWILFRSMRKWYREDAQAAQVGLRDENEIYDRMKEISKDHRPARLKYLFTEGLFWLPLLAFRLGRKVASVIFYPILSVMDKEQQKAIDEVRRKGKTLPVERPVERSDSRPVVIITDEEEKPASPPIPTGGVMVEGDNAVRCGMCHFMVPAMGSHTCVPVKPAPEPAVRKTVRPELSECRKCHLLVTIGQVHRCESIKTSDCPECDREIVAEQVHVCLSKQGLVQCEDCGTTYKPDFDHACPEIEDDDEDDKELCADCDRSYDPSTEVHKTRNCMKCKKAHCSKAVCA